MYYLLSTDLYAMQIFIFWGIDDLFWQFAKPRKVGIFHDAIRHFVATNTFGNEHDKI